MTRHLFSPVCYGLTLFCTFSPADMQAQKTQDKKQATKRTNILFLLTDDQSYHTVHALGNPEVVTPNMDRLVKSGTAFTQNHVMGGMQGAISMPSRAMLMTGLYSQHLTHDGRVIPEKDKTFPELFRENGYVTFATGKWHSDKDAFNRSFSTGSNIFFGGMQQYETDGHFRPFLHEYDPAGKYEKGTFRTKFSSVCYADASIEFLKNRKDRNKPFLIYVAFNSPHDPRTPPPGYGHKYEAGEIPLPLNFLSRHPFDNGDLGVRDEVFLPLPR
ncbi:MAG: sulfatase-like hydrolase/transferase, partial [Tannerella sp.]|nr:sulfatase-like hydrolase/transferase [Tannerella sp.]